MDEPPRGLDPRRSPAAHPCGGGNFPIKVGALSLQRQRAEEFRGKGGAGPKWSLTFREIGRYAVATQLPRKGQAANSATSRTWKHRNPCDVTILTSSAWRHVVGNGVLFFWTYIQGGVPTLVAAQIRKRSDPLIGVSKFCSTIAAKCEDTKQRDSEISFRLMSFVLLVL